MHICEAVCCNALQPLAAQQAHTWVHLNPGSSLASDLSAQPTLLKDGSSSCEQHNDSASTCTCRIAGGGTSRPHPVTSCPPLFFQVVGWMRQRISRTFDGCFAAADAQNRAELVPLIRNRTREKSRVLAGQLHARTLNSPTFSFCFCSLDNPEGVCVCFEKSRISSICSQRGHVAAEQHTRHFLFFFSL